MRPSLGNVISLTLLSSAALAETPSRDEPAILIERVIDFRARHQELAGNYAFRETTVTRDLHEDGRVRNSRSETYLVTPAAGGEYRRLVEKDGEPLSPAEESEEEKKFQKFLGEQLELSSDEREAKTKERLDRRTKRFRERLEEALEVYDFESLPDVELQGQPLRVFRFVPKPGYEGRSRATKILARTEGKVWIDARRNQLARIELRVRESLKFLGGIFGRLSEGSEAFAEARFDGDELWFLDQVDVSLDARFYFLKKYRQQILVDYHDYEKHTIVTDERITGPPERR